MRAWPVLLACAAAPLLLILAAPDPSIEDRLASHRNLGKAFYENPATQKEALEEFRKALAIAPDSTREQLNHALALLRAGKTAEGAAALERVQERAPALPHTWFNLGIQYKKAGETEKAVRQFERMIQLVPDEPISHYNLGALYRQTGRTADAIAQFERASQLDPNLAAPHFQLYNLFRGGPRAADAKQRLDEFQRLKKLTEGSATPEDVEWSAWSEIYEIIEPAAEIAPGPLRFRSQPLTRTDALPSQERVDSNNDGALDPLPPGAQNGGARAWIDYDHDYDLDLLFAGPGAGTKLLRNRGAAGWDDRTADLPLAPGEPSGIVVFRVTPDTRGIDFAIAYRNRPGVLYRDQLLGKFTAADIAIPAGAANLHAEDLDNDGAIDLLYLHSGRVFVLWNQKGSLRPPVALGMETQAFTTSDLENRGLLDIVGAGVALRNHGRRKFTAEKLAATADCTELASLDANSDGKADLACARSKGPALLLNVSPSRHTWTRIRPHGIRNLKIPRHAEIEIKAGSRYQKRIYTGGALVAGLGDRTLIDAVRITWPNGLIQNEVKQPANRLLSFKEAQRLSGSCPIIWTWNGRGWEYITDVLGVAPLGAASGDGEYFPTDHDEYIQISGESLALKDGKYEIRVTEELSEVAYLDHLRLIAVDHPADVEVFTNEKFKGPPFPEFRLFGSAVKTRPIGARDGAGDVLPKLLARDGAYPDRFERDLAGVAALHALEIEFPRNAGNVLVLHGWVDWADGSTFLRLAQEKRGGLTAPYLQVRDAAGAWVTVLEDMGMPAGKPKTIAVDLTGKWLSESRAVRIVTNLCVYWDEAFLIPANRAPAARITSLPPLSAALRFRGFSPSRIHPERKQPEAFSYDGASPVSLWNPTPGLYTRYGAVRELTEAIDDKLVVMGSGDELRLEWDASRLPPLSEGWRRDFLLLVDGWAKDRDANTAHGQFTEPLPFHRMTRFPYPAGESFPDTAEYRSYRAEYNTRPALRLLRPLPPADHAR